MIRLVAFRAGARDDLAARLCPLSPACGDLPISATVLAFAASYALTLLMAGASLARSGLRGARRLLWTGFGLGLLASAAEPIIAFQLQPLALAMGGLERGLWFEMAVVAGIAAFTCLVIGGSLFRLGLLLHRRHARRRADVVALATGLGAGLALAATLLRIGLAGVWPPSALFVAFIYPPVQLGFVLLLAAGVLAARDGGPWRALFWQAAAVAVQGGYQLVLHANATVGHWLAWLEPAQLGRLWLVLVVLAWALGFAVMTALGRATPEPRRQPAQYRLLRPGLWLSLAALVLIPTAFALGFSLFVELDARIAWLMFLALLSTPVMVGAILLQTAFCLRAAE